MAEYKKWLELSDEEKEALRKRWTTGKESDSSLLAKLEESVPQRKEIKAFLALSCKDSKDLEDNLRKIFKEVGIKIVSGCQTMGSENLFSWVSTRMKGCSIGIVIYNALNRPNITFEYGMMIGMEEKIKHIIVLADNNFRDELERFGSPFSDVIAPCRPRFFRLQELKTGTSGAIAEFKEKIWGDIWFVICEFYDLPKDDDEKCNEYKEYWLGKKTGKGIKDLQIRALTYRSEGDRFSGSKDYHNAIRSYREALKIFTLKDFPQDYAMTQSNLGNAYGNLPTGDRGENLKRAIECYHEALKVYTLKDFPQDYARTQNNLGNAYGNLPTGDRVENLKRAIECYHEALKVSTLENFPYQFAMTQNNLGTAYSELSTGERAENLEKAIQCYKEALKVRTFEDFPQDYAMTQNNLGLAYSNLPTGDRAENLKKAIQCYEEALRVYTPKSFPYENQLVQKNLERARKVSEELL